MNKDYVIKRIICATVSFLLSVFSALMIFCGVIFTACSESFVNFVINKSGYLEHSYSALQIHLEDLTIPSGLPIDFFHSKIDKSLFENRALEAVSRNIEKAETSFSREEIKNEFYTLAYDYALTQNHAIGDDSYESLMGFAEECCDSYIKYVNPSSVKFVLGYFGMIKKYTVYAACCTAVLCLAAGLLLYYLTRGKDFKKHLIFSLSADSLFCTVIPLILLISREIRKVALTSEALYSLTVTFIEGLLWLLVILGIIFAFTVAVLAYFNSHSTRFRNKET